jgi:ATP-dependent Lhr-like helicase
LLLRSLRALELRGDVRGGRFVAGWAGEQYALPAAVQGLRAARQPAAAAHA